MAHLPDRRPTAGLTSSATPLPQQPQAGPLCHVARPARLPIFALFVMLLQGGTGCYSVAHNSVDSVGGEEVGRELDEAPEPQRVAALRDEFVHLDERVDPEDAARAAALAIRYSQLLADTYRVVKPVELSNVLVNLGFKRRGRCYEL